MDPETRKWIWIVVGLLTLAALLAAGIVFVAFGAPSKPTITLGAPASGAQLSEEQNVIVRSTSTDSNGVVRVELRVDDAVVKLENVSIPQKSFVVEQAWQAKPGQHTLSVRAYNAHGIVSDPAMVRVNVAVTNPTPMPPMPTAIPSPTEAPPGPCANNATFLTDITVPDGTPLTPGQAFNKIWRVMNNGACPWSENYQFVFVSGEAMSTRNTISVPYTAPGATADLIVPMTAPNVAGPHAGRWQLRGDSGAFFGALLDARINVITPQPTPPACTGNPQIASFTASATTIAPHTLIALNWGAVSNATAIRIDPGVGAVTAPGSFQVVVDHTTTFVLTAYCGTTPSNANVTVYVQATPPTPTPIPPTPKPAFRVTGATATVNPSNWTGSCPGTFTYAGNITTNDAGTITYRWVGSGSTSPSPVMSFNAPSAGAFALPGYQAQWGSKGGQSAQLMILSPNSLSSNQASFTNSCADPKPAAPEAQVLEPSNGFVGSTLVPVHIAFRARGANSLHHITLFGNGVQLAQQTSPGATSEILGQFDWRPGAGRVEIYAVAEDVYGQTTRSATIVGEIKAPAPPPTPAPPTPIPPTPVPVVRRNINGTWVAGDYQLTLNEAIGCTTECAVAGQLMKAVLPAPEIHAVSGHLNTNNGVVSWSVTMPGGQNFNGTVSADSRTMSGALSGVGSLTFTKK
ncbi:MAG: hypothetical protein HY868_19830 [Chloroflexi bacterium]|nr:hypothetical protein [Chloroflexota bacterium]